jgi:predicted nucleic acid-binding protein
VKAFLDTSVLVATFYGEHEHHEPSFALFSRQKKSTACTAAHCLAEVYSVVTAMPGKDRASPDEALLFLRDARDRLTTVTLDESEYFKILEDAAAAGISGGTTYDAIIAGCALKVKAQTVYTWNVKHFNRLGANIAARVRQPTLISD